MKVNELLMLVVTGLISAVLCADVVELKDGTRIDGRILAENDDNIEIQIGQNDAGTIRRVLIIHSSEISSWMADQDGRISRDQGAEVHRLGSTEYIEGLLREAEKEIDRDQYDRGIKQFGEAADLATQKLEGLEPGDQVEALKMRAHALRLQYAALEGKADFLEKKTEGVSDEMEEREKDLKNDIEDFKKKKEAYQDEMAERKVQLGERHKQSDLVVREKELVQRQIQFSEMKAKTDRAVKEYEENLIKTKTQMNLVKERVDQAEDDAKDAEKALKRR